MKKLILFLFISVFTISCSSDNNVDDTSQTTDPIIGTWGVFSLAGTEASDCEKRSTIIFKSDRTANATTYQENPNNNNNCETVGATPENATWENMGNGVYKIVNSNTTLTWNISFTDNNNTLTITNEDVVYKRR